MCPCSCECGLRSGMHCVHLCVPMFILHCMHVCVPERQRLFRIFHCFPSQNFSLLIPEIPLSLPSQGWDCRGMPPFPAFDVYTEDLKKDLHNCAASIYVLSYLFTPEMNSKVPLVTDMLPNVKLEVLSVCYSISMNENNKSMNLSIGWRKKKCHWMKLLSVLSALEFS